MLLHCPHLQLHPFIPSYGKWLSGTIDICLSTERARARHHINSPYNCPVPPPPLSENEKQAQNIYSIAWLFLFSLKGLVSLLALECSALIV